MQMMTTMNPSKNNKVILGLSGGVDSTTAALLLKEKGQEITGLFFDVSTDNVQGREAAQRVAASMEIPFIYKNVHDEFEKIVVQNFCREYACGRTPNPCIMCNPMIKFKLLLNEAIAKGADNIATGHYARIIDGTIHIARNAKKDQSYMLYRLTSDVLERLILPLGEVENKEMVRDYARAHEMENADKKDSQEICFISDEDGGYLNFLSQRGIPSKEGNFVDKNNKIIGRHQGITHYTVGQRKGLGMTFGKPTFVISLNPTDNVVMLGDNDDLMQTIVTSTNHVFLGKETNQVPDAYLGVPLTAKIRYAASPSAAMIISSKDGVVKTQFESPQRAVTPGQSIVFYDGDKLVGGGFIGQ
jgi:tRNA-uridine 2-sulfurtransferase